MLNSIDMNKTVALTKAAKCLVIVVFLFLTTSPSWSEEFQVVSEKRLEKEAVHSASLIALRGYIQIDGRLNGSVLQIGGTLIISGHVKEDVIALGTDVSLRDNAVIEGDCLLIGGHLERSESAQIKGEYFFVKLGSKEIHSTVFPLLWGTQTITLLKFIKVILWMLLGLMVYAILPVRLHAMSLLFEKGGVLKHGLTGLLTVATIAVLLLIFIFLSLVFIGIPLLLVLFIAGTALLLVGRTLLMYILGSALVKMLKQSNPILSICLGALIFGMIKFIPVMGVLVLIVVDLIGIGIVVTYLLILRKKG